MIWLLLLLPLAARAQDAAVTQGAEIFRKTCAVAYCHGPNGAAGRAPQLAGHHLAARRVVFGIVANGKPNTGMPGFSNLLQTDEIEAVAAYVMTLKGDGPGPASAVPKAPELPASLRRGRDLFFDAARTGACGACHEIGGRGIPVGPDLRGRQPESLRALRQAPGRNVVTVRPAGEAAFPGLALQQTAGQVTLYDLGSALPVRRSFQPADVTMTPGASWSHREPAALYSDAELDAIAAYLRGLP